MPSKVYDPKKKLCKALTATNFTNKSPMSSLHDKPQLIIFSIFKASDSSIKTCNISLISKRHLYAILSLINSAHSIFYKKIKCFFIKHLNIIITMLYTLLM